MSDSSSSSTSSSVPSLRDHLWRHKTECALWLTRLITLWFTLLFLVPIIGVWSSSACFQKALLAAAATSALRLHQRLPAFRLSREYLALVLLEDSAHYLLFAVLFVGSLPVSLALLPIALFAFLHFSAFTLQCIDLNGGQQTRGVIGEVLARVVGQYQRQILQTVAMAEVVLMPVLIVGLFSGQVSLLTPFLYYRFLSLRYSSRRNPYSRQMWSESRQWTQEMVARPFCPPLVRQVALRAVALIERLAPPLLSN